MMTNCELTVGVTYIGTLYQTDTFPGYTYQFPVDPAQITLRNGSWSGKVKVPVSKAPGGHLVVFWNDLGASSDPLQMP